jgi:glycosyltransferase involved in cell wall biosynthesis
VEPDDEGDLARALAEWAADPDERARRGAAAREAACDRYSWPGIERQVEAVLAGAAAATSLPGA